MIRTEVPPNVIDTGVNPCNNIGNTATTAKNKAPTVVTYFNT